MGLLDGKKALVMGVGNKRSIAWGIATAFQREGADLAFNWPSERLKENVLELVGTLPRHESIPVDANQRKLLTLLDGTRTRDELAKAMSVPGEVIDRAMGALMGVALLEP